MAKNGNAARWYHYPLRLTFRVTIIGAAYVLPTWIGLSEDAARPWRETCVVALAAALAAWVSTQGQRRPTRPVDNGEKKQASPSSILERLAKRVPPRGHCPKNE